MGSNPINAKWHCSPIGRGNRLKICKVWVQIPSMLLKNRVKEKMYDSSRAD